MVRSEALSESGDVRNYADGEWTTPTSDDGQEVLDPATGERLAYVPFSSTADVDVLSELTGE